MSPVIFSFYSPEAHRAPIFLIIESFLFDNYFSPGKVYFADQFFCVIFLLQLIIEYKLLDHSHLAIQQERKSKARSNMILK